MSDRNALQSLELATAEVKAGPREQSVLAIVVNRYGTREFHSFSGKTEELKVLRLECLKIVKQLVQDVGQTDAHGPIYAPRPIHMQLGPKWGDKTPQSLEMLDGFLATLDRWFETGEEKDPLPPPRR